VTGSGGAGNFFGLIGEVDNAYYSGTATPADASTWLTRLHTPGSWTTDNINGLDLPTLVFGGSSSVSVAVPEPSAFLYFGLVACGGLAYRWKQILSFFKR